MGIYTDLWKARVETARQELDFRSCGCGASEPDEDEIERIIREVEEEHEDQPTVIPIETDDDGIPVINWPVRREVEIEVE